MVSQAKAKEVKFCNNDFKGCPTMSVFISIHCNKYLSGLTAGAQRTFSYKDISIVFGMYFNRTQRRVTLSFYLRSQEGKMDSEIPAPVSVTKSLALVHRHILSLECVKV